MNEHVWAAVDDYVSQLLVPPDPVLEAVLQACAAAGLPSIHVTPQQGKLLFLLAMARGARNILELGTLGGYSTIWLARALPASGRLITLEADATYAAVAHSNIDRAGLSSAVEILVGRAQDTLPQLAAENRGPFDLIFIDADKPSYPDYFGWAMRLSHRGSLIIADNVVREGKVIDAESADPSVQGVRCFLQLLAADNRVSATVIQTVGSKGYDGMALGIVTVDP